MSLSQALSAALDGLNATQSGMALIASNVANAGTPGYTEKTLSLAPVTAGGDGVGVDVTGVNRQLDQLLQSQFWTESSGGAYADLVNQIYQQLQTAYGSPSSTGSSSSSSSLQSTYSNFTGALQNLQSNPSDYSSQTAVIGAAQALTGQLNDLTSTVQELRSNCESGLASSVTQANTLLANIAQINTTVAGMPGSDATSDTLLDERDEDITQLATLMDIRVVPGNGNQVSVFTTTGVQLAGTTAGTLSFNSHGTLSANAQWNANPSLSGVGTITLTSPGGATTDLIATNAIKSGQIGAYLQMRDTVLPQAQSQLDQIAASVSSALSDSQTSGTAVVASGAQSGFSVDTGSLLPGNSVTVSYTASPGNAPHTLTIVDVSDPTSLPLPSPDPDNPVVGVDFSAGMTGAVAALNAQFGNQLQFSNPSGTTLQVVNSVSGNNSVTVNSVTATSTQTGLTGGTSQLPFFTDGSTPYSGAITGGVSEMVGYAGRIEVNPELVANPGDLVSYQASTQSGDPTRPDFLASQLTSAQLTYSPQTGIGSTTQPYTGTLSDYIGQVLNTQGANAASAQSLSSGQDVVVNSLQQSLNNQSGVNIDDEMANLLALQNAYSANARVLTTVNQMFTTLLQAFTT
jgi:flagellar hook-associated protein 1